MALAALSPLCWRKHKERNLMDTTFSWLDSWRLSPLALSMLLPLCDPPAEARGLTDPAMIDRAVAEFTGAAIGAPGGARVATDPRLQLAACAGSLSVSWHTAARNAVQVECPGPTSWRIFVAIAPSTGNAAAGKPAPAVKRGDAITVMVRGRGFSVQQPGEAMEAGAVGDWIEVRTSRKGEPLRARIERPGLAVIPAA
jgi:flagella basal body P-ring formation protein FlgA